MSSILPSPSMLSIAASFVTWQIYKKFEPSNLLATVFLLVGVPAAIAQVSVSEFSSLSLAIVVVFMSYWALLVTFIVAYRLSPFHPLAGYPGPLWCKLSKVRLATIYSKGAAREYFAELHAQYGDVVRIGPNELSFRSAEAVAPILSSKPLPKGPYYESRVQKDVAQLDGMRDFAEHTKRRKLWNKSVSPAAVRTYGEIMKSVILELIEAFEKRQGEAIDLSVWMGYTSFDFMGQMAFSRKFGLVQAGKDTDGLLRAVDQGTGDATVVSHVPWVLPFLSKLPAAGALKFLQQFTADVAKQRIASGSAKRDLYSYLIAEDEPEDARPSVAAATADGMLAIIAGSDTSATALSHVFYFMLRNPDCMKRLQKEIDETFPDAHTDDLFDYSKHADMPYLNACINEAMRLLPPAQSGLQRRVERGTGGKMIGAHFVPEDTQVSAHLPLIQRDPRYFYPIPNQFWPDRFLSQEAYALPSGDVITKDQLIHERSLFLPFSAGPQNCAGRAIALQEMRAVLVAVYKLFEVQKMDGFELGTWEKNVKDFYITHRGPLMVNLKARSH